MVQNFEDVCESAETEDDKRTRPGGRGARHIHTKRRIIRSISRLNTADSRASCGGGGEGEGISGQEMVAENKNYPEFNVSRQRQYQQQKN